MEYLSKKAETAFSIQKEELEWNKKTPDEKAKRDSLYFQHQDTMMKQLNKQLDQQQRETHQLMQQM